MMQQEIVDRVNSLLHQGFEIPMDRLKPEADLFQDLSLDSLDAVDLMVHLEDNLGIKVEGEAFRDVRKLGDVYSMVQKMADQKAASA